jgi:hypothetical protein
MCTSPFYKQRIGHRCSAYRLVDVVCGVLEVCIMSLRSSCSITNTTYMIYTVAIHVALSLLLSTAHTRAAFCRVYTTTALPGCRLRTAVSLALHGNTREYKQSMRMLPSIIKATMAVRAINNVTNEVKKFFKEHTWLQEAAAAAYCGSLHTAYLVLSADLVYLLALSFACCAMLLDEHVQCCEHCTRGLQVQQAPSPSAAKTAPAVDTAQSVRLECYPTFPSRIY